MVNVMDLPSQLDPPHQDSNFTVCDSWKLEELILDYRTFVHVFFLASIYTLYGRISFDCKRHAFL